MWKEAWGFQCQELLLAQTFCIWLFSLGVSLGPGQSSNLNVILFHDCLEFQEGWNVPWVIHGVSNNLAKVCVSGPRAGQSAWKIQFS